MNGKDGPRPEGEIVLYQPQEGSGRIWVLLEGRTVWLPQAMIAELFKTSVPNINIHLKNIYEEGELDETATVKEYLIVRQEGSREVSRKVLRYSLDAILAVGYRVKFPLATGFRQWATARLHGYLVKGFTLDDERLKGGSGLVDYFDELLAPIREIRASEARVYQRIWEIFALACDYREGEEETQRFFATMQNKMHHAATGMTAAVGGRRRNRSALRGRLADIRENAGDGTRETARKENRADQKGKGRRQTRAGQGGKIMNRPAAQKKWKPYPRYKPLGVEWLGDAPSMWSSARYSTNHYRNNRPPTTPG